MSFINNKSKISIGIVFSITEVICTIIIASIVKFIAVETSVFVILFFRYLFCIPLLLITAIYQRKLKAFHVVAKLSLAIRTITGLGSFGCLFAALQFIDISLMTTLLQTMPLFVTLLAPMVIKEVVGWYRKIIALIGFGGVLLILDPFSKEWNNIGIIFGLLSPFFGALMTIYVRKLSNTDHPTTIALWYNVFGLIIFMFICILDKSELPKNNHLLFLLIMIGILSSFQQYFLAYSLKMAPVSLLAPLRYISVPIGIVVGVYVFNEIISSTFYVGSLIIVFSSLVIIKREGKKTLHFKK